MHLRAPCGRLPVEVSMNNVATDRSRYETSIRRRNRHYKKYTHGWWLASGALCRSDAALLMFLLSPFYQRMAQNQLLSTCIAGRGQGGRASIEVRPQQRLTERTYTSRPLVYHSAALLFFGKEEQSGRDAVIFPLIVSEPE